MPGGDHLLPLQERLQHTVLQRLAVPRQQHVGEHGLQTRAVPGDDVVLAVHPRVPVHGGEIPFGPVDAVLPEGVGIIPLKITAQKVEHHRRPFPVPGAHLGRRFLVGRAPFPDILVKRPPPAPLLRMGELFGEGVRHPQALLVRKHRALLDQVPVQDHHVSAVMIGTAQRLILILDELAVDLRHLRLRLCIRKR